jgi:RNA methyltransferase, TrmH family
VSDAPVLTSTRNPRVRAAAALSRRRERVARGQHLAEGPRAVGEALAGGGVVEVLLTPDRVGELRIPDGVTVHVVSEHVLASVADATSPQGVVAVVTTPHATLEEVLVGDLTLVLDRVADPGNVGTIIRTADAAGASGVVVTAGSADPFGPKAARAAVGSSYHLPIATDVDLAAVRSRCVTHGRRLLGLDAAAERSVFDLRPGEGPIALVLGSEAHGLLDTRALDGTLAIPIAGRAESLNVAAAAAVAAFAVGRALRHESNG